MKARAPRVLGGGLTLAAALWTTPLPAIAQADMCIPLDARSGWTSVRFPVPVSGIAAITGRWTVGPDPMVGHTGHLGKAAEALAPYNAYKINAQEPFGTVLVKTADATVAVHNGTRFSAPVTSLVLGINDTTLGDNRGKLTICFVSATQNASKSGIPPQQVSRAPGPRLEKLAADIVEAAAQKMWTKVALLATEARRLSPDKLPSLDFLEGRARAEEGQFGLARRLLEKYLAAADADAPNLANARNILKQIDARDAAPFRRELALARQSVEAGDTEGGFRKLIGIVRDKRAPASVKADAAALLRKIEATTQ